MSFTSTLPSAVNDRGYNSAWFPLSAADDLSRENTRPISIFTPWIYSIMLTENILKFFQRKNLNPVKPIQFKYFRYSSHTQVNYIDDQDS